MSIRHDFRYLGLSLWSVIHAARQGDTEALDVLEGVVDGTEVGLASEQVAAREELARLRGRRVVGLRIARRG